MAGGVRADPDNPSSKLVTVRLEDVPLEGLLGTITWIDLVGVTDAEEARRLLLTRIQQALVGRAKPAKRPGFPLDPETPAAHAVVDAVSGPQLRRTPVAPPPLPDGGPAGQCGLDHPAAHRRAALRPWAAEGRRTAGGGRAAGQHLG